MMGNFTGKPDQFDGKLTMVSCRFSQQNQSIDDPTLVSKLLQPPLMYQTVVLEVYLPLVTFGS